METYVGVVWGIGKGSDPLLLVTDRTPLREAEPYGDFLTHARGHYEIWESWRRLGPADLVQRGLPALIAWHEYEHFPRGRVVFDTTVHRFTLYADRRVQQQGVLSGIFEEFGLEAEDCDVRSDPHYRSVREL